MKSIVIFTGKGYVGHKGGAHMQINARPECAQLFGDDPAKIDNEVGLFEGEYMVEVDIKFKNRINLKGKKK